MKTSRKIVFVSALFLLAMVSKTTPAGSAVLKKLTFNSEPSGADVYIKRGLKEIHIGKTPLVYQIEFHSERSIVKILFRRSAHRSKTLEIDPTQKNVYVQLEQIPILSDPGRYNDKDLRRIHSSHHSMLNDLLPKLMAGQQNSNFELTGKLYFLKDRGKIYLVLPLEDTTKLKPKYLNPPEPFLEKLWQTINLEILAPLASELRKRGLVTGLIVDVQLTTSYYRTITKKKRVTTMQWVGGYERDWSSTTVKYIYNPFHHQVPVTRTERQVAAGTTRQSTGYARYSAALDLIARKKQPNQSLQGLNVLLVDGNGVQKFKQGILPDIEITPLE